MTPKKTEKEILEEEKENIQYSEVSDVMRKSYLDYAMSVIVSRAIPSIEDGMKPVQRRILYSMHQMGLKPGSQTKKSARIVGDVIGKYHPHGDTAVYETMVRMAQDFSMRYPLVFGQGNFGCFTADTKVKLADGRDLSFLELIEENNQGKRNFTFTVNEEGIIKIAEIKNPRKTIINAEIMKVTLDNGEEIKCTLNHKFMLKNGNYKKARDLISGDSLMPAYFKLSTDRGNPKTIGYNMIFQPKLKSWNFIHFLADEYNLEEGIYTKSSGRIRHHIDFNKLNNNPDNIKRMNWGDHWRTHYNFTSQKHKLDEDYRRKLSEGRKNFWENPRNREAYSIRMRDKNLKNWKKPSYQIKMKELLSEVNKEYLRNHPEKIEEIRIRSSITMKRLWRNPYYKEIFHKKIIVSNKKRTSNNTGKKKFLRICEYLLENNLQINKQDYENTRRDIFGIKSFTSWDLGIKKYFEDNKNLILYELNKNHKVVKTEFLKEHADVYDLTIDKTHNFALASGIFVHNSIDGDPPAAYRYCVTGDSLVLTEKGIIPIKEISEKEKVNIGIMSYNGKKNSASKWFDSGKHKTIKILTKTHYSLEGSYNHPIMVWKIGENFKPCYEWKLLEELNKGDIVLINRKHNLFANSSFKLKKYFPKKGFKNKIILPLEMNKDLAFLLGALVSEGSFHNKQILFNNKDIDFYNKVKSIILSQFKGVQLYERQIKGGCKELSIYEQKVVIFLKNIGLKSVKSPEKEIPFSVLMSKKEHLKSFLISLFEGDGSVQKIIDKRHKGKTIQLSYDSKSKKLINQLKIVLLNFGITSNSPYIDKRNGCLKLCISAWDNIKKFYEEIGFFSKRKTEILKLINKINPSRLSKNDFIPFLNDYIRRKYSGEFILKNNFDRYNSLSKNYLSLIKLLDSEDKKLIDWILKNRFYFDQLINIEKKEKLKNVYSLRVESECHSFVANGFVNHNTEAKLMPISSELLQDLDKETVKFNPNFDNSLKEPELLPGKLPALILNGATGIAVGMATNIPPHNLREVCDAITEYIKKPEMSIEDLCNIIQGPDFPTGGMIQGNMREIYEKGKGRIIIRGRTITESTKNRNLVIITEIPYLLNKSTLVTQIADLVQSKKIKNVSDLRDESSKGKIRIVLETKKDTDSKFIINSLYKYTRLQDSFNANFLALSKGQPKILNLKNIIEEYVNYRKEVITNRSKYELRKAKERREIVEGLLIALKNIDEVIKLIRASKNAPEASSSLIKKFNLSSRQASAILETKLQQLTSMEKEKLKKEQEILEEKIKELEKILADIKEILKIIVKEIKELRNKYGDERKTSVLKNFKEIKEKDLIQKKEVMVTITDRGYCKRMDVETYREQKRGGRGILGSSLATGDFVKKILSCSTYDYLLFFTTRGRVLWLKAYELPSAERYSKGKALVNILGLKDESITNIIPLKSFEGYLFMATKRGIVKKISLDYFSKPRVSGIKAIKLPVDDSDFLIGVKVIGKDDEVFLATKKGKAIKFDSGSIRNMGRASYGVTGIKLDKDDEVVSLENLNTDAIMTITRNGYGKRTNVKDYRKTARAGKGVINLKIIEKNGNVVTAIAVNEKDNIIITTAKGIVMRTSLDNIRIMGRAAHGVRVIKLQQGDYVTDLIRVSEKEINGVGN